MPDNAPTAAHPAEPPTDPTAGASTGVPPLGRHPDTGPLLAGPPGYDLLEEVGRGSMGVVYRARDVSVRRDVAVKLLQDHYPPVGRAARRFLDEARITGQLQHPGVPAVHQVGTLPDGRPFLAMKLIKGQTLADLLKTSPDRGRLVAAFEGICQAVGYAHAHGVIHRDLKPANVMVGAFGEVQVMDWGLAKLLSVSREAESSEPSADPQATTSDTVIQSLREESDQTQDGQAMGTPAFMPPEQAVGAVAEMDRRSDVFGLGAVLCMLLTGRPPYLGSDGASTRALAARAKLDDAYARLDGCGADPDWVALCRRCLAPDRADRPADAGAVADAVATLRAAADDRARAAEVEKGRAVVREAEGRKRRRLLAGAGGLVFAAVLAGGLAAGLQWRRAEAARVAESEQKQAAAGERDAKAAALAEAEVAQGKTVEALRKLTGHLVEDNLARKPELTAEDRTYLREVLGLWQAVADTRSDTPAARELRAQGAWRVGPVYSKLGQAADAEAAHRQALALYGELAAEFPTHPDYRDGLASAHANLAALLKAAGRPAEAEAAFRAALAVWGKLAADLPADLGYHNDLARTHTNLGFLLWEADRVAEAEAAFRVALARSNELVADSPDRAAYLTDLAHAHAGLGVLLGDTGRPAEAEAAFRTALAIRGRLADGFPARPKYRDELATTHTNLGVVLGQGGRTAEAEAAYRAALDIRGKLAADFPAFPGYRVNLGISRCNLGHLLDDTDRPAEALDWFTQAIAVLAPAHAADPAQVKPKQFLRNSHGFRAVALDKLGRHAEAVADWDKTVELSPPAERPALRAERATTLMQAGQTERAVAEVAELAALPQKWSVNRRYNFACVYAVASGKAADKREEYAGRAVAQLQKAVAAGYRDRAHMLKDTDLDPLRGRADFRALLASLPERAPPPRPVR